MIARNDYGREGWHVTIYISIKYENLVPTLGSTRFYYAIGYQ